MARIKKDGVGCCTSGNGAPSADGDTAWRQGEYGPGQTAQPAAGTTTRRVKHSKSSGLAYRDRRQGGAGERAQGLQGFSDSAFVIFL
jgi:hypothetical protein